jgi:hypothetical protein
MKNLLQLIDNLYDYAICKIVWSLLVASVLSVREVRQIFVLYRDGRILLRDLGTLTHLCFAYLGAMEKIRI